MPKKIKMRLAKAIAHAGYCSRRKAEELIDAGRVTIDGVKITKIPTLVSEEQIISIDGEDLKRDVAIKLWAYHKPRGLLTTHSDPQNRPTIFQNIPISERVISIGRLDFNSEGLLLLTNNGALARFAELPETGWERQYKVKIFGTINPKALASLTKPFSIEGIRYRPFEIDASVVDFKKNNNWLKIMIREGKNREIRKAMEHIGLTVSKLIRIKYGPYVLGNLKEGEVKMIDHNLSGWKNI